MRLRSTSPLAIPAVILVLVAAVIPLIVLSASVISGADVVSIWSKSSVQRAVIFSTWQALLSTALTMCLGLPTTWFVSRYDFFARQVFMALVTVTFVLPTVAVGAAYLAILPKGLHHSTIAIVIAHAFFNISIVVRTVGPRWNSIDDRLIDCARTLGASPLHIWKSIILPLGKSAILSSAALTFFMCFTSYGVISILGGPGLATLDIEIYRRAVQLGDLSGAAVLAVAQMLLIATIFFIWSRGRTSELISFRSRTLKLHKLPLGPKLFLLGVAAFFIAPVLALVASSLRTGRSWSLTGWRVLLGIQNQKGIEIDTWQALQTSAKYALIAACIALPTGIATTYAFSHRQLANRQLSTLAILPLAISPVVVGLAILITYDFDPFDFRSSWLLIPIIHSAIALPFVIRASLPVVQGIPNDLRSAAATLGAGPWRRLLTVEIPLLRPAISTGFAFSLAMSLGEFGATSFLTRRESRTLPIIIAGLFGQAGEIPRATGMAASVVLILVTAMIVLAVDRKSYS